MKISSLSLRNIRSFCGETSIDFSDTINIIIGQNNTGKSTVLKSIYCFQDKQAMFHTDISKKITAESNIRTIVPTSGVTPAKKPDIKITLVREPFNFAKDLNNRLQLIYQTPSDLITDIYAERYLQDDLYHINFKFEKQLKNERDILQPIFGSTDNDNLIYPFFSNRKVNNFETNVNEISIKQTSNNLYNLYPKIANLNNRSHPKHDTFRQMCMYLLGFEVGTQYKGNGQVAGTVISATDIIPIDKMGDGVANLLGLIVNLCIAEHKIFLIEEPENDIHPQALKRLLDLIKNASANNQFIISTHSNIVLKHLGTEPNSKVFKVSSEFDRQRNYPVSSIKEVNSTEERLEVLEELGYEFSDYGLFKGWIIFEESSAEEIIRDFLIPQFYPKLKGIIRTFSAGSKDKVAEKFANFNNLFVFANLSEIYKNKAWVIIDAGGDEQIEIDKIKAIYSSWNKENFIQFQEHNFEAYYPEVFKNKFKEFIERPKDMTKNKDERKKEKKTSKKHY